MTSEQILPSSTFAEAMTTVEGVAARLKDVLTTRSLDETAPVTIAACASALQEAATDLETYWRTREHDNWEGQ